MGARRPMPSDPQKLYHDGNDRDKKVVEAIKNRLNDLLSKNPQACKKAAMILENWLHQKSKK